MLPNGRLSLVTASPYMNTVTTGATTLYYTPAIGTNMYYWTGSLWASDTFPELSCDITDASNGPAVMAASKRYDMFVWKDGSGVYQLSWGPAWTSTTVRGAGAGTSELVMQSGFFVNKYDITNGPAAGYGLFVGSVQTAPDGKLAHVSNTTFAAEPSSIINAYNLRQTPGSGFDVWAAPTVDPYWNQTLYLIRANATNNGYKDWSKYNHSIGTLGSPSLDSGTVKWTGIYSMKLPTNSGNGILLPTSFRTSDWQAVDWTFEVWAYLASGTQGQCIFDFKGANANLSSSAPNGFAVYLSTVASSPYGIGFAGPTINTASGVVSAGAWHHIALVLNYSGGSATLYVDGYAQVGAAWTFNAQLSTWQSALGVGGTGGNTNAIGWFDQFRITKGIQRYTGNFTSALPNAPFPTS